MGFYPHGKPDWYSYTKHFEEVGHDDIYHFAFNNTQYPGISAEGSNEAVYAKALANLEALIAGARAAEAKFLADTGIDVTNMNGKDIFRAINEILNSKETFERGMQYMKQLSNAKENGELQKNQMYRDVSRYFMNYLNKTIIDMFGKNGPLTKGQILKMNAAQLRQVINDIIGQALERTYTSVQDFINKEEKTIRGKFGADAKSIAGLEQEKQAIGDMITTIQKLKDKGVFGQYGYLFNFDENDVNTILDRSSKRQLRLHRNKYNSAQVDSAYGGNALELITSTVAAEIGRINIQKSSGDFTLTIQGQHTGQANQMKADTLLFVGHGPINIPDYLSLVDSDKTDSTRLQNIDAIEAYLNKLENNVQHVIAISDKNYSITASFSGVEPQSKMNLQNAGEMLTRFGVGQVRELINYLANCGASMIQGAVNDDVRTVLQTQIAYYLFDHLEFNIKGSASVNVVNLLNVSGIYVPLSVYLEGILNSIKQAISMPASSLVGVSISLGGPTEENVWTAGTWDSFREQHEQQSFIEYRILRNMADFISGLA